MNLKELIKNLGRKKTANLAKERLQILVSHERATTNTEDLLPKLRQELLEVLGKYFPIDADNLSVELQKEDKCSVLELNVTLPSMQKAEV